MITVQELQARRKVGIQQILENLQTEIIVADDQSERFIKYNASHLSERDAKMLMHELKRAGYRVDYTRGGYGYGRVDPYLFLTIIWE